MPFIFKKSSKHSKNIQFSNNTPSIYSNKYKKSKHNDKSIAKSVDKSHSSINSTEKSTKHSNKSIIRLEDDTKRSKYTNSITDDSSLKKIKTKKINIKDSEIQTENN
jgi:hypothetical protein